MTHETIALSESAPPVRINGGTRIYHHAGGSITPTNIGDNTDNTDFKIRVT